MHVVYIYSACFTIIDTTISDTTITDTTIIYTTITDSTIIYTAITDTTIWPVEPDFRR